MYVLVNTETTDVEKYATLDDLLMACMKKNGILHSFSAVAKAAASVATSNVVVSTPPKSDPTSITNVSSEPMQEAQSTPITEVAGNTVVKDVVWRHAFNQNSSDRVEWSALDDARRLDGTAVEALFETQNDRETLEEYVDEHTLNSLEVLDRFNDLKKELESRKHKLSYEKQQENFRTFYRNEFVNKFCKGTTTNITKANFSRAALRILMEHPEKFGIDTSKYRAFFESDHRCWHEASSLDGFTHPIFVGGDPIFDDFLGIADMLYIEFENTRLSYDAIEKLVYLSYNAILTDEVRLELLEEWIRAFVCKSTKSSDTDTIKSSTLYETFIEYLNSFINPDVRNYLGKYGDKLRLLLTTNISQKVFSRILKTMGWKSQRKSDGIYWQSVGFGTPTTSEPQSSATYTDTVAAYNENDSFASVENFNPGIPPKETRAAIYSYSVKHPLSVAGDGETEIPHETIISNTVLGALRKKSQGAAALRIINMKDFA